jgi:Zn-dependent protease/predicted transcriptional regulator
MGWSFRIARVFGIDIKIHLTFLLILGLGAVQWGVPFGVNGALFGILLMILLFTCVTLHELGHSVVAQRFGITVREIVLLPLGGVALLARNPSRPLHELLIAIAGPLVNVFIAVGLLAVTGFSAAVGVLDGRGLIGGEFQPSVETLLFWLLAANVSLVLFNMIPAFPLDGGRVLRAVLAMFIGFQRATRIATVIGQIAAVIMGVIGIVSGNIILALVAIFIFLGAGQENAEGQVHTMLTTRRVGDFYNRHALTLEVGDRVSKVANYILTSYQPDFAVMQSGQLLGVITRDDVLRALGSDTRDLYVTGVMKRDVVRLTHLMTLEEARQAMMGNNVRVAAVYESETYLGLISLEDISEAFAVIAFQERQQQARRQEEQAGSA